MSARATAWAWECIKSGRAANAAALVLLKLADRADERGYCWPGHDTTSADCNLGKRTAERAVQALKLAGLLNIQVRFDAITDRQLSNGYQLRIDQGFGALDASKDKGGRQIDDLPPIAKMTIPPRQNDDPGVVILTTESKTGISHKNPPPQAVEAVVVATENLIWPTCFIEHHKPPACAMLARVKENSRQPLLDEISGMQESGTAVVKPLGLLRHLIRHLTNGSLILEHAGSVAAQRNRPRPATSALATPHCSPPSQETRSKLAALRSSFQVRSVH